MRPVQEKRWLTSGVWGIGLASFLADVGHEVPTALFAGLVTITLGAPAAALGLIEGLADGLAGLARFAGGALADDPHRRRTIALGGYSLTALLAALIGAAGAIWQEVYGRAYGFERMMDNLGAVGGPLLALLLVALLGIRWAIGLSVSPGLLAALSILYAIRHISRATARERVPLNITVRPLLQGRLAQVLVGVSLFETANLATTLLILRATQLLAPSLGVTTATEVAIGLYTGYNAAATVASLPAGRMSDQWGPIGVLVAGVFCFLVAYLGFAVSVPSIALLAASFVVAGQTCGGPLSASWPRYRALAISWPVASQDSCAPCYRQPLPLCTWRSRL